MNSESHDSSSPKKVVAALDYATPRRPSTENLRVPNLVAPLFKGFLLLAGVLIGASVGSEVGSALSAPNGPPVWTKEVTLRAGPFVPGTQHPNATAEVMKLAQDHREQITRTVWIDTGASLLKLRWPPGRAAPDANELRSRLEVSPVAADGSFSVTAIGRDAEECEVIADVICKRYADFDFWHRDIFIISTSLPGIRQPSDIGKKVATGTGILIGLASMLLFIRCLPTRRIVAHTHEAV
jgi:hypothetical protein